MSASSDQDRTAQDQAAPELPGYRYVRHLGSGGYSKVYLYEQQMPRRNVAIKVISGTGLTDETRNQFTAEANAMAGLADHPNIVQVFDAAIAGDGRPYLVMQYCPQPNLSVRARREHFTVAEVLRIGIQIGSAVETAHRNEILHRDIKPHNVLTGQFGTPALADFGIAARKGAEGGSQGGISVPWSPPEVVYGVSDGDERADVYSLGATLWHILAGRSPFEDPGGDNSILALMHRIQSDPLPATGRGDVPDSLERLLRQAMAKDPAARPQSALDLVRALQAIEQEQRLPLTQIVIAEDPVSSAGQALRKESQESADEATMVRGASRIGPAPADTTATRVRGSARVEPMPVPRPALPPRTRQIPGSEPAEDTRTRRAVAAKPEPGQADLQAGAEPTARRSQAGRRITVAAAVVVTIGVVIGVLAIPGHSHGKNPAGGGHTGTGGGAIVPGAFPGTPTVIVASQADGEVRFDWTYANQEPGDAFRWYRISAGSGPASGSTKKPTLLLPWPKGKSVCIAVQVVRADGSEASARSQPRCTS